MMSEILAEILDYRNLNCKGNCKCEALLQTMEVFHGLVITLGFLIITGRELFHDLGIFKDFTIMEDITDSERNEYSGYFSEKRFDYTRVAKKSTFDDAWSSEEEDDEDYEDEENEKEKEKPSVNDFVERHDPHPKDI